MKTMKLYAVFSGLFRNSKNEEHLLFLHTESTTLFLSSDLSNWFNSNVVKKIVNKISDFQEGPSNLTLSQIISLTVHIHKRIITHGGGTWIDTPDYIKRKKATRNIKKIDNYCFLHCINAFVNWPTLPPIEDLQLDIKNLKFPLDVKDVRKFEAKNRFSVNVFGIDSTKELFIYYRTRNYKGKDFHLNLLLLEQGKK